MEFPIGQFICSMQGAKNLSFANQLKTVFNNEQVSYHDFGTFFRASLYKKLKPFHF
jgi:hypothetical protein